MTRHSWCCCCCLLLLLAPCMISASVERENYLHLLQRNRVLRSVGHGTPAGSNSVCSGKKAGEPVDGQYIIFFDPAKVTSAANGIKKVQKALRQQAIATSTAAGFPANATEATTPALTFGLKKTLSSDTVSSSGSGTGRRLLRAVWPPVIGAVVTVPPGAQGAAVVQSIQQVDSVLSTVPDVCVRTMETDTFSCMPAAMLSSLVKEPIASASWDGCLTGNTHLAWWGQRCGSSFSQVQWMGVYAFDKTTGARLPACVKQRPSGAATQDTRFWLGGCGTAPGAVPNLPTRVCRDPYVASTVISPAEQGCFDFNFTDATQTLQIIHPVQGCSTKQPVSMVYKGQRCTSNDGSSSNPSLAGVLWQSAEPAEGSGMDATKCSLQRRTTTTADDVIFNMDWFGSCGVPPSRVQYLSRSECPAPPPPPPPSPSPRPDSMKALDREPVLPGETVPTGIRRILAATANVNAPAGMDTVKVMRTTTVAVLDTGVDCTHRDLNIVFNISFVEPLNPIDELGDANGCRDQKNHGTNVAGIIGAKNNGWGVVGVLPNAGIASLKVLDSEGAGPSSNILDGCLWLLKSSLDGVNPNPDNATNAQMLEVDVVNMSFGWPDSPYTSLGNKACQVIKALRDVGIVPVAAAGNEQSALNNAMPSACEGIIAVTAIEQGNGTIDTTQDAATWFSNFLVLEGSTPPTPNKANLTVAAPGEDIYSTCYQQCSPYCEKTGTSQATPHVSGMMARCFSGYRCQRGGSGDVSVKYAVNKWMDYNMDNQEYGYIKDPIRNPRSNYYWGYLTCADVW